MAKKRKGHWTIARRVVQIVVAILFFVPLSAAGWSALGLGFSSPEEPLATPSGFAWWGSLSSSHLFGLDLLDPFAALQVAAAVLALSAVCSVPVFELVNPISAVNKAVLFGSFAGVFTLVAIVFAELFWARRVWCRALCPLGGMYETLGCVGLVSVKIDHDLCVHCGACQTACLCDPEILDDALSGKAGRVVAGDCMLCGKCVDACPHSALKIGLAPPRHPEL